MDPRHRKFVRRDRLPRFAENHWGLVNTKPSYVANICIHIICVIYIYIHNSNSNNNSNNNNNICIYIYDTRFIHILGTYDGV